MSPAGAGRSARKSVAERIARSASSRPIHGAIRPTEPPAPNPRARPVNYTAATAGRTAQPNHSPRPFKTERAIPHATRLPPAKLRPRQPNPASRTPVTTPKNIFQAENRRLQPDSNRGQRGKQLAHTLQTAKKHIDCFIGEIEPPIKRGEVTSLEGQPLIDRARAIVSAMRDDKPKAISDAERLNREIRKGLAMAGCPPGVAVSPRAPRQLLNRGLPGQTGTERPRMEQLLAGYGLARY
jgi:hypothetical protein